MRRKDAIANTGKPVFCWTALNGSYIGILEGVTDDRPFRAVVKTLAVVDYPVHGMAGPIGFLARLPFALYSRHEYGAVSIRLYDTQTEGEIPGWRDSAIASLEYQLRSVRDTVEAGERLQSRNYLKAAKPLKMAIVSMEQQLTYLQEHRECTGVIFNKE